MFCLRSWLPLLFIPTNASPAFIVIFLLCNYLISRPCVYCSILLVALFCTSCYWSDHCFFDIHSNWFEPRHLSSPLPNPIPHAVNESLGMSNMTMEQASFLSTTFNNTCAGLAGAALDEIRRRTQSRPEWTGIGMEWLRSLIGKRDWRVPCLDVGIRL